MTSRAWLGLVLMVVVSAPAAAERRAIRTFTAADGLPRDQVKTLLTDSRGFLWLGTEDGLARFDGVQFTLFGANEGLRHPSVRDLLEDRTGHYWIATGDGVYRFTPSPRQFLRLPERGDANIPTASGTGDTAAASWTHAANVLVQDRDDIIWCGTSHGLYRARQDDAGGWRLEDVPLDLDPTEHGRVVGALFEARDGTLWIGTGSGLFRRARDGRVDRFTRSDGLPENEVWALTQDAAGYLWVGTRFGLAQLDIGGSPARPTILHTYTEREGLPAANVKALSPAPNGDIWAGLTWGVVRLSARAGARAGAHAIERVLPGLLVRDLATDSAGHLWIASDTGAVRLAHGGFVTYGEEDGLMAARVRSLFEDRDGRVCATVRGDGYRLQCFDGRRFSMVRVPVREDAWNPMWGWLHLTVMDRAGSWWLPTANGLYHFAAAPVASLAARAPAAIYTRRDGLDANHVFRLFEDSRGDLWMSTYDDTRNGLCRRDRATGRIRCYGEADGLPPRAPSAFAFAEDRAGQVWVGFEDGYLARCEARCTFVMRDNGTVPGVLRDLHVDRAGRLWIASASGGVARIDDPRVAAPQVTRYTQADGLSSETIWAITEDEAGPCRCPA